MLYALAQPVVASMDPAGELTGAVTFDRFGRRIIGAHSLQSLGIEQPRQARPMLHPHRGRSTQPIKMKKVERSVTMLVVADHANPTIASQRRCLRDDLFDRFRRRANVEIHTRSASGHGQQMHMMIVQSRDQCAAICVDHLIGSASWKVLADRRDESAVEQYVDDSTLDLRAADE